MKNFLPGSKTYITLLVMAIVAITQVVPQLHVFSPNVESSVLVILSAVAAYFRSLA